MTQPTSLGTVLLVDGSAADAARLGTLPDVEQTSSAEFGQRLDRAALVDVVVIGSLVSGTVAAVQRTRSHVPDAGVVVLADDVAAVRLKLTFAPGVPLDVLVLNPLDPGVADRVAEVRLTVRRRRRHAAVLAAVVRHADATGGTQTTPVTDVGALLEHAPMAIFLAGAEGELRGWNRRAEELFDLRPTLSGQLLNSIVPGTAALLSAAVRASVTAGAGTAVQPALHLNVGGTDVQLNAVRSLGPDGKAVVLVIATDVTEQRRAERERDRLADQVSLLSRVSVVLTESLDISETLSRLAGALVPAVADRVSFQLRGEQHRLDDVVLRQRDADSPPMSAATLALIRRTSAVTAAVRRAAVGEVVLLPEIDVDGLSEPVVDDDKRAQLTEGEAASALAVPLKGRSGALGSMLLVRGGARRGFADDDRDLAAEVGRRAGIALDNARVFDGQRHLATELQQSLLTDPPTQDFADIVVRYVAAGQQALVGGDWYDAFRQPDGDLALVIGDVVGHDTRAAAEMGQLRALVRGISFITAGGPDQTLTAVDTAIHGLQLPTMATAIVAQLTPAADGDTVGGLRFRWSSAGHPPPLLLDAGGEARLLEPENGKADLLLGVNAEASRRTTSVRLPAGSTLLLYTDGLIEKRDQSIDEGLAALLQAVRRHATHSLDDLCDAVLKDMVPDAGQDDVALLAVRPHVRDGSGSALDVAEGVVDIEAVRASWRRTLSAPDLPLTETLPLTGLRELRQVRRRVRTILVEALQSAGVHADDDVEELVGRSILVIDEMASNALRHGAQPAELQLRDGGDYWLVTVMDSAPDVLPLPAVDRPAGQGGYGLYVIADLTVDHGVEIVGDTKRVWAVLATRPGS